MAVLKTKRRPSAVSQVISEVSRQFKTTDDQDFIEENEPFSFTVATDHASRKQAYELAYQVYSDSGYVDNDEGLCISDHDGGPNVFTLIAKNSEGEAVGTVTLNFEQGQTLPCDEVFNSELSALRKMNRRLVEITRLAIAPEYQHSRTLLMRLFHFLYVHSFHNMKQSDFIIEVHPRHVDFYTRLLGFKQLSESKPCERVNGSPAVLLSISIKSFSHQVSRIRSNQIKSKKEVSRFALTYFDETVENKVKEFLKGKNSAWTPLEFELYQNQMSTFVK